MHLPSLPSLVLALATALSVVAPSANRSGRPSPTTFADAVEQALLDARFTAPHAYGAMSGTFDPATDDPATAGVSSAYLSTYRDYLSRDLNYKTPMNFRSLNNMEVAAAWDHSHRAPGNQRRTSPNVALDLAAHPVIQRLQERLFGQIRAIDRGAMALGEPEQYAKLGARQF